MLPKVFNIYFISFNSVFFVFVIILSSYDLPLTLPPFPIKPAITDISSCAVSPATRAFEYFVGSSNTGSSNICNVEVNGENGEGALQLGLNLSSIDP